MSRRYLPAVIETGDLTHPWDLQANLYAIAEEVNGHLDRDNLTAGTLTASDFSTGAFGTIRYSASTNTQSISNIAGSTSTGWIRLANVSVTWAARDGRALLEGRCILERNTSAYYARCTLGIELDGDVVAASEPFNFHHERRNTLTVQAEVPMAAGAHAAYLVARIDTPDAGAKIIDYVTRALLVEEILA